MSSKLSLAAVWLLLPVVGVIVAATLEPIPPHDFWWHLAMGRLIAAGQMPETNLFLYTLDPTLEFVNQPWLGQWLMWSAYDLFGYAGPVVLRNFLLATAFSLIVWTAWRRSGDARAAGALGLLAAMVAYPVLTVRTRMFAFLPFVLVLWASLGVAEGRLSRRWLLVVPLATVFWANVHGSFVLAPVLVGAVGGGWFVQRKLERASIDGRTVAMWGATLCATVLAGAVTPLGFGVYSYVAQLTMESSVAHSVTEWRPPNLSELRGQLFLCAMILTLGLTALDRKNMFLADALLFAGTLTLAAGAVRSMFWWAAIVPIVVATPLARRLPPQDESLPSTTERVGLVIALTVLVGVAVVVQPGVGRQAIGAWSATGQARQDGTGAWLMNHENAFAAVERVRADQRERVFHDQVLGGMLEVMLTDATPRPVAYVDQRMEFVPDEVWARYFALSRAAPNWDRELERIGVDTLILSPQSQWPLLQAALRSPRWRVELVDQSHVLLYSLDGAQHPAK